MRIIKDFKNFKRLSPIRKFFRVLLCFIIIVNFYLAIRSFSRAEHYKDYLSIILNFFISIIILGLIVELKLNFIENIFTHKDN